MDAAIVLGLVFVLPAIVMVAGAVIGGRLRDDARPWVRWTARIVGFIALVTAWEVCWCSLVVATRGVDEPVLSARALIWVAAQPVGLAISWRTAFLRA